ncbi:MAG: hypothetical protein ACI8RD_008955 [Bacillariaceae sp.]|jgi:hypothetical protein
MITCMPSYIKYNTDCFSSQLIASVVVVVVDPSD